jgi:hypothetical protein
MYNQKIPIFAIVILAVASIANAELTLTINGFDAAKLPEIKGRDNLVITIAGQSDIEAQDISITCDTGKLEPLKEPGKYLFTFTAESDVSTISLNVCKEIVYKLVLFYIPETDTVIVFGLDKEALASSPRYESQSVQQIPEPETYGFATFSIGDCNEILDSNWYPNLNNDSFVNFKDFAILATNWLLSGSALDGDINGSGKVDNNDLAILTYYWLANACGPLPEEVFESFKSALLADDVNEAVGYFAETSAENYRLLLEQLRPYFTQMVSEMGELVFIRYDADMAVYDLLREEDGRTYGYPAAFVRDKMGQWKIFDF